MRSCSASSTSPIWTRSKFPRIPAPSGGQEYQTIAFPRILGRDTCWDRAPTWTRIASGKCSDGKKKPPCGMAAGRFLLPFWGRFRITPSPVTRTVCILNADGSHPYCAGNAASGFPGGHAHAMGCVFPTDPEISLRFRVGAVHSFKLRDGDGMLDTAHRTAAIDLVTAVAGCAAALVLCSGLHTGDKIGLTYQAAAE